MVFFYLWQGYRIPFKRISVDFGEYKTVNTRSFDGFFVSSETPMKSIRNAIASMNRKNKRTTNVTAIHSTIYDGNDVESMSVLGHIIPLDLDGVDLATSIFISDYIKKKYKLNGRTIILRTDKGHHIYIMNIVPYSKYMQILDDPLIVNYEDKDHREINRKHGFCSMRVTSTKYGKDNEIKVVFDEGEDVGDAEAEFARFLLRMIKL